jgi:hypothetical protein
MQVTALQPGNLARRDRSQGPGRGWLAGLELPAASREIVADCLAVIDGLAPVIDRIDGELRQHAKRSPEFADTYATIAKRRGKKIATIAISRELLTRAWHLLNQLEPADAVTGRCRLITRQHLQQFPASPPILIPEFGQTA